MLSTCLENRDQRVIMASLDGVLAFSGTSLNLLILYVFYKKRNLWKKKPNRFVFALTVSCLIQTAVVAPYRILRLARTEIREICSTIIDNIEPVNFLLIISGMYHAVIAYDRYYYIVRQSTYNDVMKGLRYAALFASPWILAVTSYIVTVTFGDVIVILYTMVLIVVIYGLYVGYYDKLIQWLIEDSNDSTVYAATRRVRHLRNRKVINLVTCLIVTNTCCVFPAFIQHVLGLMSEFFMHTWLFWRTHNALFDEVVHMCYLVSASTNAILYLSKNKEFFRSMRRFVRRSNQVLPTATT